MHSMFVLPPLRNIHDLLQLQKEVLAAKEQIERQSTLILSLEASLEQRAVVPLDSPEHEKYVMVTCDVRMPCLT
jgi:hypothetical protein